MKLTYLGRIMVDKVLDAKLCSTEEEAVQLICSEWHSPAVQDVLLGYANSGEDGSR